MNTLDIISCEKIVKVAMFKDYYTTLGVLMEWVKNGGKRFDMEEFIYDSKRVDGLKDAFEGICMLKNELFHIASEYSLLKVDKELPFENDYIDVELWEDVMSIRINWMFGQSHSCWFSFNEPVKGDKIIIKPYPYGGIVDDSIKYHRAESEHMSNEEKSNIIYDGIIEDKKVNYI